MAGGSDDPRPTKARSTSQAPPKPRPGSRWRMRSNTSPLAGDSGSHQPRPSWLTIRIRPGPARYLRQRRVLSRLSSAHPGCSASSTRGAAHPRSDPLQVLVVALHGSAPVRCVAGRSRLVLALAPLPTPVPSRRPRSGRGARAPAQQAGAQRLPLAARPAQAASSGVQLTPTPCLCCSLYRNVGTSLGGRSHASHGRYSRRPPAWSTCPTSEEQGPHLLNEGRRPRSHGGHTGTPGPQGQV